METRIYRHFCMMARALEVVGERWSLLIVRDLTLGPQRFTDLVRGLAEITPATLTNRLRQLETSGVVTREQTGRGREVWYGLTEAGGDLGPVVEALTLWGVEHALESPRGGEPVYPIPTMIGTKAWLGRHATPPHPVTWVWGFPGDNAYTLTFDEGVWALSRGGADHADVIVDAIPEAWARFMTTPRASREFGNDVRLVGTSNAIKVFTKAFRGALSGR
jgi:DNA-binding HxlR family transcriptional regulator